jgi:hypothetical protein
MTSSDALEKAIQSMKKEEEHFSSSAQKILRARAKTWIKIHKALAKKERGGREK